MLYFSLWEKNPIFLENLTRRCRFFVTLPQIDSPTPTPPTVLICAYAYTCKCSTVQNSAFLSFKRRKREMELLPRRRHPISLSPMGEKEKRSRSSLFRFVSPHNISCSGFNRKRRRRTNENPFFPRLCSPSKNGPWKILGSPFVMSIHPLDSFQANQPDQAAQFARED